MPIYFYNRVNAKSIAKMLKGGIILAQAGNDAPSFKLIGYCCFSRLILGMLWVQRRFTTPIPVDAVQKNRGLV